MDIRGVERGGNNVPGTHGPDHDVLQANDEGSTILVFT